MASACIPPRYLYYLIFGQTHPLRDSWVLIEASCGQRAREIAFESFGPKFAFCYEEFQFDKTQFPAGQAGHILVGG